MKTRSKMILSTKILIGLVLGIICGLLLQGNPTFATNYIAPIGTLFLNLLKMIIVPLVLSSLIMGACGVGDVKKLCKIGLITFVFFIATTAFAVVIGLIIGSFFKIDPAILSIPVNASYAAKEAPSFVSVILNLIPTNPFAAIAEGNMLQIIVFSLFIGVGITIVGKKADPFKDAVDGFAEIMFAITNVIMKLAPYTVFALIVPVIALNGPSVLLPLFKLVVAVYVACFLHAVLVYAPAVLFIAKRSPVKFLKAMLPAIMFAFSTSSSAATIPFTMEGVAKMGVKEPVRAFVIPLGATINMDGTAVFQGICTLFIAAAYGIDLTLGQICTVVIAATLASIGTAGIPGASTIMLGMVLASVNLPFEGIAVIMGVESILDMARTAVNILGDATCSLVVAATSGELESPNENANIHS